MTQKSRSERFEAMYAMDNSEHIIKIGFSADGHTRIRTHEREGWRLLAAWPATHDDEQATHRLLKPYRVPGRGNEKYRGEAVYDYVTGLLARNYAVPTFEDVRSLPRLPFEVWKFGTLLSHVRQDGQISLVEGFQPWDRPAVVSDLAWLNSASDEWFSPQTIVEPARRAMGSIDTDPASCAEANRTIRANTWYGREQDGLDPRHPWVGNVWLNPPYGRGDASAQNFLQRLCKEVSGGDVHQAITCLNLNSMSALWFVPIMDLATAHCIYKGRVNFTPPGGDGSSSPTKGTVLSYFGANAGAFAGEFGPLGHILIVRTS